MESVPDESGPATAAPRRRGWFMRLPLWLRILGPVALVIVLVGGATAVFVITQQRDPVDVARSVCLSGVRSELEGRDREVVEMPLLRDVDDVGDGTYRTQGQVRFTEADGSERSVVVADVEPGSRLEWWWWDGEQPATHVSLTLTPAVSGTRVVVVESGRVAGPVCRALGGLMLVPGPCGSSAWEVGPSPRVLA